MLEKPLGVPIVGIYTSCMKLRKLSILAMLAYLSLGWVSF